MGDFNGDGVLDLAVANAGNRISSDGTVSVLLGNGDGTFQEARNFEAGNFRAVAVGDFNGDGVLDLAATDGYSNTVSVLLGSGDGTFRAAVNFDAGVQPWSVSVGDFNGDGVPDLALGHTYPGDSVSVLLGNGDGTFQTPLNFVAGSAPQSVAVCDFNGDGVMDLAVANAASNDGVSVLLGNGDGTFQAAVNFRAGAQSWSVAVGDFNGDGVPDLAIGNLGCPNDLCDSSVSVLLGNGDGTFQAAVNFDAGTTIRSVAVGDFNGDGLPDLAVAHSTFSSPSGLAVLINDTPSHLTKVLGSPSRLLDANK